MNKKQNKTAKKVLAGSLAVAMLTSNVGVISASNSIIPSVTENIVSAQVNEGITTRTIQTAANFSELETILLAKPSNITINLTGDIEVPEGKRLEILVQSQNVVIDGQGKYKINLNETSNDTTSKNSNKFYVRGKGTEIKNTTIEGYKSSAMYLFSTASNVRVENVTLNGNGGSVGLDLAGAKVTLKDITSNEHTLSGIRLRSSAAVTYEGGNEHNNDHKPLVIIDQNGTTGGTVDSSLAPADEKQYTYIDTFVNGNATNNYYALAYLVDVHNHQELVNALAKPNTYITLKNDITLQDNVTITNEMTTIKGEGFTIYGGTHKLTVNTQQNVVIENVNFRDYTSNILSIWNTKNVKISNVKMFGNLDGTSKNGIDIKNSTEVVLSDIYTRNHTLRAIQIRGGSGVTLVGDNRHYGDKSDIQILHGDSENGALSTLNGATNYDQQAPVVSGQLTSIEYLAHSRNDVPTVALDEVVTISKGSQYDALDWVQPIDLQDNWDNEIDNITVTVLNDGIVINTEGTYEVTYEVKDYDGNIVNVKRIVNVILVPDAPNNDEVDDDMGIFTLAEKVEQILGDTETTDEEKLEQFKEALEQEGIDTSDTSDEIYKEVLDYIKNDGEGNYDTSEEIKQLIQDVEDTKTETADPSHKPVQDFNFVDKVVEKVLSDTDATDEEKIEKFKELLKVEGMSEADVDGVENDILKEVLDFIQKDIDNLTGNYKTLDDVKQLIKDIEDTRTNVTLPSDEPVQDFTFIEKVEELVKDDAKTDEEKLEDFKDLVTDEGINTDGVTDDVFEEVFDHIKDDIENGTGEYVTPEDFEQLIEDIKNTKTEVTLPSDKPVQDVTFIDELEEIVNNNTTTNEEKVEQFKDALVNAGVSEDEVNGTSNEIYEEVLGYIKDDINNLEDEYKTLEDVKELIQAVKDTKTEVTLPSDKVVNGIKDIETLEKELQEKVDSLVIETTKTDDGLKVTVKGDKEDLENVDYIEITKDGIFAVVDGQKLPFGNVDLSGLGDLTGERAVRLDEKGGHHAIPHENINGTIKINSKNFENILITHRVPEPFVDVLDKHWFKGDVEDAYNYVFTKGTGSDTFSPKASITRGEFAVMIARALELQPKGDKVSFKDIEGKWYEKEAQALFESGIVKGFPDGTFGGNKTITRQEAATMLVNMLKYAGMDTTPTKQADLIDMDKVSGFAKPSVQFLAEQGVLSGNEFKEFKPLNNLTRSEMAKILVKSLRLTDLY